MRSFVEECLLSSGSAGGRFFDQKYIRRMLEADRDGKDQFRRHIYLLVSFEMWHQKFLRH
jgi:asparagine synthase (glutamine-hydrolysing)